MAKTSRYRVKTTPKLVVPPPPPPPTSAWLKLFLPPPPPTPLVVGVKLHVPTPLPFCSPPPLPVIDDQSLGGMAHDSSHILQVDTDSRYLWYINRMNYNGFPVDRVIHYYLG